MEKTNESSKEDTLLVWFNGMEIESIRHAIFNYLDRDEFTNNYNKDEAIKLEEIELDKIEQLFNHKRENFESYDSLEINLTLHQIYKIIKVITIEEEKEKKENKHYDDYEYPKNKKNYEQYSYKFFYIKELGKLKEKFDFILKRVKKN
ncbi:MAG: hypothetical protein FWB86_06370 [Treponema sp.]|nr:hypothetical protein [Treponema sp.]MCL2251871.1 hypothetical protein [Treponema sp.]